MGLPGPVVTGAERPGCSAVGGVGGGTGAGGGGLGGGGGVTGPGRSRRSAGASAAAGPAGEPRAASRPHTAASRSHRPVPTAIGRTHPVGMTTPRDITILTNVLSTAGWLTITARAAKSIDNANFGFHPTLTRITRMDGKKEQLFCPSRGGGESRPVRRRRLSDIHLGGCQASQPPTQGVLTSPSGDPDGFFAAVCGNRPADCSFLPQDWELSYPSFPSCRYDRQSNPWRRIC